MGWKALIAKVDQVRIHSPNGVVLSRTANNQTVEGYQLVRESGQLQVRYSFITDLAEVILS